MRHDLPSFEGQRVAGDERLEEERVGHAGHGSAPEVEVEKTDLWTARADVWRKTKPCQCSREGRCEFRVDPVEFAPARGVSR